MPDSLRPTGEEIIDLLKAGKLPQMVDWFDPLVLGLVAVRTLISSTIGEYADQRPMQEAADGQRDMKRLSRRHDYSEVDDPGRPSKVIPPDASAENPYYALDPVNAIDDAILQKARADRQLKFEDGAFWIDFIADLGDGFEATYAMAYLLAQPRLEIQRASRKEGVEDLPAGQILILGGDLAYPNATEEEYRRRCLEPYDWAFPFTPDLENPDLREPPRELFFIAGNHDWYDGLASFSNQFCYETTAIGGWRCTQQRSYFALQLPYRWWIWGVDVALSDSLDVAQRHYFEAIVSRRMEDGDKIIIILHAPDWFKHEYKALTMICQLARQKGEVCAILAGDLHHYSRFESKKREPSLNLITSGGGGAFAHPTHDQKNRIYVSEKVAGPSRTGREAVQTLKEDAKTGSTIRFTARRKQFYPTKFRSRLLALKNLVLPLHNWRFAAFIGLVYMIYAWVFQIAIADPSVALKNAQHVNIEMQCLTENPRDTTLAHACTETKRAAFDKKLEDLTTLSDRDQTTVAAPAARDEVGAKIAKLLGNVEAQGGWWNYLWGVLGVQFAPDRVLSGMLASPAFFFMIAGLWIGLVQYAEIDLASTFLRWSVKVVIGTAHAGAHLTVLLATNSMLDIVYNFFAQSHNLAVKVGGIALYTVLMVGIGGLLGAFVFGIYWVLTSLLLGMHPDAFSALGVKNYKNFLRMKLEENKLTIYPIALDRVPGRYGWKANKDGGPLIKPKKQLTPRLIETPIEIKRPTSFGL
jgi:hypothetical protein